MGSFESATFVVVSATPAEINGSAFEKPVKN